MNTPTVLTGLGLLTATGIGVEAVWRSILEERAPCRSITYRVESESITYPSCRIDEIPLADFTTESERNQIAESHLEGDRDFAMLVVAARLAIAQSNLRFDPYENRIGLVLAHEHPGILSLVDRLLRQFTSQPPAEQRLPGIRECLQAYGNHFYNLQTFPHLFYLARLLGLKGPTLVLNNACASGLYALEAASQMIRSGQAESVVVVTSDHAHVTEYLWLRELGFSSPSERMRPFHRHRDGAIMGDGAAAVVLEAADHARQRDAPIHAEYLSGCFVQDTWRMSMPDPAAGSYEKAIGGALQRAGISPEQVDLVVPHATGSPLLDRYEANGIRRAFEPGAPPPVTALKPYVGHTLGASALLETVVMIRAMQAGRIPPILGCDDPDPAIKVPLVTEWLDRPLQVTMKTVSAFGGFTAASLFRRWG